MKIHWTNVIVFLLLVSLALPACGSAPVVQPTSQPAQPIEPQPTAPKATVEVDRPTQPPAPTVAPTSTPIPAPTQIKHLTKPGDPTFFDAQTTIDCTIGRTYVTNEPVVIPPSCDNPALSYSERPVAAGTKDYLPYLDIGQAQFGGTADWFFARIIVYDDTVAPKGPGDSYYMFKLDLNFDGRNGNVVIVAVKNLPLSATNWTVNGAQAWTVADGTVTPVFDQGVGADPDLVWARRSPKAIEIAFKPAILNGNTRFAWWAWTYQGTLTPPDFILSPVPADIFQIDNTCAWGFNGSSGALISTCIRN